MSSTEEAKEFLSDNYDGEPSDWKRLKKTKKGSCEVRLFESKDTGQRVEIMNFAGRDYFYPTARIPKNFWIVLPDDITEKLNNGELDESYVAPCGEDDDTDLGYKEGSLVVAFQEANDPITSKTWHDQHVNWFIQEYHGVTDFVKDFDEVTENTNILITAKSIKEVLDRLTSRGLTFLGYYKSPWS